MGDGLESFAPTLPLPQFELATTLGKWTGEYGNCTKGSQGLTYCDFQVINYCTVATTPPDFNVNGFFIHDLLFVPPATAWYVEGACVRFSGPWACLLLPTAVEASFSPQRYTWDLHLQSLRPDKLTTRMTIYKALFAGVSIVFGEVVLTAVYPIVHIAIVRRSQAYWNGTPAPSCSTGPLGKCSYAVKTNCTVATTPPDYNVGIINSGNYVGISALSRDT